MGRPVDSIVRQGDERRTSIHNKTVVMAGCLGELQTARLWRQADISRGDRDLAGGNDC